MAGSGWDTTLVLVNMGTAPVTLNELFLKADGTLNSFAIRTQPDIGTLTTSAVQVVLNPKSTLNLILYDTGAPLQEGWSLLSINDPQATIGGYAVIRHQGPGGSFSFETNVPLSDMQDYSEYIPFDNTSGFMTELTLVNPAFNLDSQVSLTYRDPAGQVLLIDSVDLKPLQQMTIVLPDTYPDLANKVGTIDVTGNTNVLSVVGLRYNAGYGVIGNIPTMK
jgi:hypothetical protein